MNESSERSFAKFTVVFFATVLFLTLTATAFYIASPPNRASVWVHELMVRKTQAANATQGRRVLLMGGSSVHFGFDAAQLEREISIPTFNLGNHGVLGFSYRLHEIRREARPGDTVVLVIEYPTLSCPDRCCPRYPADYARHFDPSYPFVMDFALLLPSLAEIEAWVSNLPGISPIARVIRAPSPFAAAPPLPINILDTATIDTHGNAPQIPFEKVPDFHRNLIRSGQPMSAKPVAEDALAELARLGVWASNNNILVVWSWAPHFKYPAYDTTPYQRNFARLKRDLMSTGLSVAGDPTDMLFAIEHMLDSSYHLNLQGRAEATDRLSNLLRPILLKARNNEVDTVTRQ